jgi:hypothetical protein
MVLRSVDSKSEQNAEHPGERTTNKRCEHKPDVGENDCENYFTHGLHAFTYLPSIATVPFPRRRSMTRCRSVEPHNKPEQGDGQNHSGDHDSLQCYPA